VRERQREGRESNPFLLIIYLVFNWSINNDDNIKTFAIFYFRFASFPGKTCDPGITVKILATLILDGGHS
jgi:hypothetical protein